MKMTMKMTVVTNEHGHVIACAEGHASSPRTSREMTTTIIPRGGQRFHEVDVPEEFAKLEPSDLLKALSGLPEVSGKIRDGSRS